MIIPYVFVAILEVNLEDSLFGKIVVFDFCWVLLLTVFEVDTDTPSFFNETEGVVVDVFCVVLLFLSKFNYKYPNYSFSFPPWI